MALIRTFRELDVYQLALLEAKEIFLLTRRFPGEERYSLTDQIRRSSRAVGAMIAEAWRRRRYPASFISKLHDALGESLETQAWLDHAAACGYISSEEQSRHDDEWERIGGKLHRMVQRSDDFCRSSRPK